MEIRIYYADTDAGGVVYHARYLEFLERGRTEFLRDRGLSVGELHHSGSIFPVVRLELNYKASARLDDVLTIETSTHALGKTSFSLSQKILRGKDRELLVEGLVTLVCVGPGMKAKRLPEELRKALEDER